MQLRHRPNKGLVVITILITFGALIYLYYNHTHDQAAKRQQCINQAISTTDDLLQNGDPSPSGRIALSSAEHSSINYCKQQYPIN